MPITNETQAKTLAILLQQLRPNWPWQQTIKTLHKNKNHPAPYPEIVKAAITKTQDPTTRTPAAIFLEGPHWTQEAKKHMPPPTPCQDHPTQPAHNCPSCKADILTGTRPPNKLGKHHPTPDTLETAFTPNTPTPNKKHVQ